MSIHSHINVTVSIHIQNTTVVMEANKDYLTGLDTKYQPRTQQKKILVFDFIASNKLTIHMDSLNGQIFPPCPPRGSGGPILG